MPPSRDRLIDDLVLLSRPRLPDGSLGNLKMSGGARPRGSNSSWGHATGSCSHVHLFILRHSDAIEKVEMSRDFEINQFETTTECGLNFVAHLKYGKQRHPRQYPPDGFK